MCGIAGKLYLDASRHVSREEVDRMRDCLGRRGPDAAGTYVDRHVGLGHRRLSVIDLEESSQPMSTPDGRIWIVFNGEIYNYRELRAGLQAEGRRFRTSGDTEVILALYERYGEDCVAKLRGMFAFAIWDARTDRLLIARDRIGVKPLYYTTARGAFLFASELKSIVADPGFREVREIDLPAVNAYLSNLCFPDPVSVYRGVFKLPAGHTLTVHKGEVALRRYWDVTFRGEPGLTEDEWAERLLHKLREAVRIRLVADVPLGAFLSGGIDSSTVVALMAGLMDRPVKTFSIGFAEREFNEATDAQVVARHLGTDHTELILSPAEARKVVPELLAYFDEPFADSSAIPTHFVSRLAREQVTVALSGDGGDELFGGYPWRQCRPAYQRALAALPKPLRVAGQGMARLLPASLPGANFLRRMGEPYPRYIVDSIAVFDLDDRVHLFSAGARETLGDSDPYRHHLAHLSRRPGQDWTEAMMAYDLKVYLPNDILTKLDRMSMFNSLEAREPLLDHELVELAARIPSGLKVKDGISKYILKKVLEPMLPGSVLNKRKQGFSVPLDGWLRTDLRQEVLDTLRSGNRHGIFDRAGLDALCDDFYRGNAGRNYQVWTLYAFEHWYRNACPAGTAGGV